MKQLLVSRHDSFFNPRRWALWTQRPRLIGYALLMEVTVVVITVTGSQRSAQVRDYSILVVLLALGVTQAEWARQTERVRRRINATPHINMSSVWTFAGVLLLQSWMISLLVASIYAHLALRSWYRLRRVPVFRTIFNASLASLTCLSAHFVLYAAGYSRVESARAGWHSFGPIAAAAATYFAVGALVAIPGLSITSMTWESVLGRWSDNALEATTIGLGAVTAVLITNAPELVVVIVPCVVTLQRGALVNQLEIAATTDEKTGLLNNAGWRHFAEQAMAHASQQTSPLIAVLMIDIDHFKSVNDRHGHLAGDAVLRAVADTIADQVRGEDTVGRFGGEEFIVLISGVSQPAVTGIAERIRKAITGLSVPTDRRDHDDSITGLSVSIGVAMLGVETPDEGLDRMIEQADTALYTAKTQGRNRVTLAA